MRRDSYGLEQEEETRPEKEVRRPVQNRIARVEKRIARVEKRARKAQRKPVPKTGPILLFLAAVLFIGGGIAYFNLERDFPQENLGAFGTVYLLVGMLMAGLGVWSLRQPLPPPVIAVVVLFVVTFAEYAYIARRSAEPKVVAVTPWYVVTLKTRPNLLILALRIAFMIGLLGAAVEAKKKGEIGEANTLAPLNE